MFLLIIRRLLISLISNQEGTLIEIQNNANLNFTNTATEEVIRALYADLR